MSAAELRERRSWPSTPLVVRECRLCWRILIIDQHHIETTERHVYVRCDHCGGSFPIRHSDVEALSPKAS